MRGGGERLSANGGYLPAQAVYRLPLETSNDIMPSVAVVASRRVEKEKEECLLFSPSPSTASTADPGLGGIRRKERPQSNTVAFKP